MRLKRRQLVVLVGAVVAALAVAVPLALAGTTLIRGSLSAGDTQQLDRLFRDGVPSTCNTSKENPGLFGNQSTQNVDAYSFWNATNQWQCVTVRLSHACGPADPENINAFSAAYDGTFYDPDDPSFEWLADAGQSGNPEQFGFIAAPFEPFQVVVSTVEEGQGGGAPTPSQVVPGTGCVSYTLTVQIGKSASQTLSFKTKPKFKWSAYDHR